MQTEWLLMAQYDGRAVIPIDLVCRDYFSHLTIDKFLRKQAAGEIEIPMIRIETSQKAARGIHLTDLAAYVDKRRAAALRETKSLCN
jgi:hypothetical protein